MSSIKQVDEQSWQVPEAHMYTVGEHSCFLYVSVLRIEQQVDSLRAHKTPFVCLTIVHNA